MNMTEKLEKAFNDQIQAEIASAYLYLSMSAHFEAANLPGFAKWMKVQSHEEWDHAMRFYNHLIERGNRVRLQAIPQPPHEFGNPLEVMEQVLNHELKVSASIHRLFELASQKKDYAAQVMLEWFVTEQVEEEKQSSDLVARMRMFGDNPAALLAVDRELGSREG